MPALNAIAGSVCSPNRWSSIAETACGLSSARSSRNGEPRPYSRWCAASRMPDIGFTSFAFDHDAVGPVHDLAELQPLDRDVFHVAIPIDADDLVGDVGVDREGRVADEARFAAGAHRLARLPMLGLALDDEGRQTAQRIGAALRGHRLPHQLRRRLRRRRLDHSRGQHQRSRKCHRDFS